ncbi:MAG: fatty acid desaturase [Acidobacteriota bacterium]
MSTASPSLEELRRVEGAKPTKLDIANLMVIGLFHLMAALMIVRACFVGVSLWTVGLGLLWFLFCGFSITAGYHRLYAHRGYEASWPVRLFFLLFGAASLQNSALKWCVDHRIHHRKTDQEEDPHAITKGFWWAHLGWILHLRDPDSQEVNRKDLVADPLVRFQHRGYLWLAILMGFAVPLGIGALWGDPIGALLFVGFLRVVVQWHVTWSINSLAHILGGKRYWKDTSARDSWLIALPALGEGYHNYHHRFPGDYRNGVRWFDLDPTKWLIWSLDKVKLARKLRRTPRKLIERALAGRAETNSEATDLPG